jgi:hypothetical protein
MTYVFMMSRVINFVMINFVMKQLVLQPPHS